MLAKLYINQKHIVTRKRSFLNFINISHRLTVIFGKKSVIVTEVHIFGIWGLGKVIVIVRAMNRLTWFKLLTNVRFLL